jgi:hypothetical protein
VAPHSQVTSEISTPKAMNLKLKEVRLVRGMDNDTGVHSVIFLPSYADR